MYYPVTAPAARRYHIVTTHFRHFICSARPLTPARRKTLATHGRTIHWGQSRRFERRHHFRSAPNSGHSQRPSVCLKGATTPVVRPIVDIHRIGRSNASRVDRVSQPGVLISPRVMRNSKRDCMAVRSICRLSLTFLMPVQTGGVKRFTPRRENTLDPRTFSASPRCHPGSRCGWL